MSSLTFSIIQTSLFWEDRQANLAMLAHKVKSIQPKTEVVVLPEMFSSGFSMQPEIVAEPMTGESVNWMKNLAAERKIILTGSLSIRENGHNYNRLIWMLPTGQFGMYDKRHLFAYADEHLHYTAGSKRLIASVKGWKINLLVCYDLRFPVWARQSGSRGAEQEPEYDVLIYVANWPEKRNVMWKTLLQARAIENQCYCIGVNRVGTDGNNIYYSGDSMVVTPLGEVLYQKAHEEDTFTFTLQKDELINIRSKMPFYKDADPFLLLHDK